MAFSPTAGPPASDPGARLILNHSFSYPHSFSYRRSAAVRGRRRSASPASMFHQLQATPLKATRSVAFSEPPQTSFCKDGRKCCCHQGYLFSVPCSAWDGTAREALPRPSHGGQELPVHDGFSEAEPRGQFRPMRSMGRRNKNLRPSLRDVGSGGTSEVCLGAGDAERRRGRAAAEQRHEMEGACTSSADRLLTSPGRPCCNRNRRCRCGSSGCFR